MVPSQEGKPFNEDSSVLPALRIAGGSKRTRNSEEIDEYKKRYWRKRSASNNPV